MMQPDHRRSARYEVQLPCHVHSPFRAFDRLAGVTVNMSRLGLLLSLKDVDASRPLPGIGHAARIVLQLPGSGQARGRCVECLGRVVRLETGQDCLRIALEFRRYQFTEAGAETARS